MAFQINSEEFEVTEDNKKKDIDYEILEAMKTISFLIDRYQQRIQAVERRKNNLLNTIKTLVAITLAFFFLAIILTLFTLRSSTGMVFAIWAVILFVIIGIIEAINVIRAIRSYCVHTGKIPNRMYTLHQEEEKLQYLLKNLEDIRERMEKFLKQEQRTEEAGRVLLGEALPQLKEDEQRAEYLYGEVDRIS